VNELKYRLGHKKNPNDIFSACENISKTFNKLDLDPEKGKLFRKSRKFSKQYNRCLKTILQTFQQKHEMQPTGNAFNTK
jgi:hypothetical protein